MAGLPRLWLRAAALAFVGAAALLLPAPEALAQSSKRMPGAGNALGVPVDGNDRIRLDDGRVMSCKVEEHKDGFVLKFASFVTPKLPKSRILEWRKFADFDPAPRTEEEKALAAKGQVRHGGRWMPKEAAEKLVKAEQDAARKIREEDDKRSVWENRWQVETPHFKIEANIPRDALDYYCEAMETFYDFFVKAFGIQLTQRGKAQKLPVFLYGKRDQFVKAAEADMPGKGDQVAGYFVITIGKEKLVFFDAPGQRDYTTEVLFHELNHFVIHLAEPQVKTARWLDEGLAEYFSSSRYEGKKFYPGPVNDIRLLTFQDMCRRNQLIPMTDLLNSGGYYRPQKDPEQVPFEGAAYAQSWALVHFMMEGKKGKYRSGLISFLSKFLTAKGVKLQAIEGSEEKYMDLDEQKMTLARCLGVKDLESVLAEAKEYALTLPLHGARAYVDRGERSFYLENDLEAANRDFNEALARGKDDAGVLTRLAIVFARIPERAAEVQPLFARAIELDPLNPRPRYYYAQHLAPEECMKELETCMQVDPDFGPAMADYALLTYQHRLRDRDRAGKDEEALVRQAIAIAERSLQLDPSERAYATLALLCMSIGEFEKALAAQKAASELSPENLNFLWKLAECHAMLGNAEDFAKLLRRIELLLRRAARPGEGETAREGAAMTKEEIDDQMGILVRRMAEKCMVWEKYKEGAIALKAWHEKRLPKAEDDWVFYATVLSMGGDRAGAAAVAERGLATFPESEMLKNYAKAAADAGAPAEGPK